MLGRTEAQRIQEFLIAAESPHQSAEKPVCSSWLPLPIYQASRGCGWIFFHISKLKTKPKLENTGKSLIAGGVASSTGAAKGAAMARGPYCCQVVAHARDLANQVCFLGPGTVVLQH